MAVDPAGTPADPDHVDGNATYDGVPVGEGTAPPGRRATPRAPARRAASNTGGRRRAGGGGNRSGGGRGRRSAGGSGQPGGDNPFAELFKSLFGGRAPTKEDLARLSAAERADFLREGLISPQDLATADGVPTGATPVADARDLANPAAWQQASFQADNLGLPTSSSLPWQTADAGGLGMFSPSSGGMPFGGISGPAFSGASVFGMG